MILVVYPNIELWDLTLRTHDRRWHELEAEKTFNMPKAEWEELIAAQKDHEIVMALLREAART